MLEKGRNSLSSLMVETLRKEGWKVQQIESPTTGKGIPDLWAIKQGFGLWIELKVDDNEFEQGQLAFLTDNVYHGGRSVVIRYYNRTRYIEVTFIKKDERHTVIQLDTKSKDFGSMLDRWLLTL